MTRTVALKGMAGLEHVEADGSFTTYVPGEPVPPPIKPGDRLRVRLAVADDVWIYAVSAIRKADHWKLGMWAPGENASGGVRMLWPGGRVLTGDEATMTTLFVIASSEELAWARDLTHADCSSLVGQMPADPPVTTCDHLYGLIWKVPKRPRGMVPPVVDVLEDGAIRMPAIVAEHSGAPFTAIEWQFKPRK